MNYLNYHQFDSIVAGFFDRFGAESEVAGSFHDRETGYYEIVPFFGPDGIDPQTVPVKILDDSFHFTDQLIAEVAADFEQSMLSEGLLRSGPPVIKLADAVWTGVKKRLIVQPCSYGLQAGSCLALDEKHERLAPYGSLREYYLAKNRSRKLCDNPLAVCLGVSALAVLGKGDKARVLTVRRSPHLASLGSTWGPSVAGSVEFGHVADDLLQLLRNGLADEISEELGLCSHDYRLIPLACAREVFRGERPQLFAAMELNMSEEELKKALDDIPGDHKEFDKYELVGLFSEPTGQSVGVPLNFEVAMNLKLLKQYLSS